MKKALSIVLAMLMPLTCVTGAFAEAETETEKTVKSAADVIDMANESADSEEAAAEEAYLQQDCEFSVIEADESTGQVKLSYMEGITPILEVDGLKFKDLNKNGTLDVYEDWREETDTRIADLIGQMDAKEEVGLLFCVNTQLADARYMVQEYALTCQLFNLNGTPITITNTLNNLQASAEAERLGVPMVFTSDREYNSFGGYIDKAHEGFGTANDPELAYELASFYGKAMRAVGIHVTFEPYANEIGAQYGENPEYIASIVHEEIRGLEENGLASCTKHWIGRGGDSSFGNARSVAQNFDNWMVGWEAALSAGSEWVMTNCGGTGISNTVDVKWDKATMSYLRDTLGFDGVVVSDWWALGGGPNNPGRMTGITSEGVDLGEQTIGWLYNEALANGTDMFGSGSMYHDYSDWESSPSSNYPDAIIDGLESGEVEKANVDQAATRILRFKFEKGLFENPYCDVDAAVELCASAEWAANPTEITNDEELRAARNPYEVELTEKLQAESAVLVKNDNNLLPLAKDAKVYIDGSGSTALEGYKKYIAEMGATVVETMDEADVVVGDYGTINDAAELFIEDAQDAGKPIVLTMNNTEPTAYALENADAVLYLSYSQAADHGSTEGGFVTGTSPWIYVDLLFGEREPGGIINKEIARDEVSDNDQWKDLAGDQGASPYVRLMVQATMEDDENHASPNNWGDPLVTYGFGMSYGQDPDFQYSCLILPTVQITEEVESGSSTTTQTTLVNETKAGEPFTVYALLRNNGADGFTITQAKANGEVVAEKIMTVEGGSWRVLQMDLTLDAGEYTIEIGDLVGTITITE
ncbi:MAG: glycoside hydrolase family 3 N-terminal domain-containing protein [Eubacteriales bacterium]|nr:glycoside hydrolase family 3 N-terminal domain-containing protein [Eubacteriales bacterium]